MQSKTETHIDFQRGTYMNIHRIQKEEGDGNNGMRAATNYALRCLELGKPWAIWDSWTCQTKFLYMTTGYEETFTQAWLQLTDTFPQIPAEQLDDKLSIVSFEPASLEHSNMCYVMSGVLQMGSS